MPRLLTLVIIVLCACSGGDRGAVVVRWRLTDATTGTTASGGCAGQQIDGSFCCASIAGRDVIVDRVQLVTEMRSDAGVVTAAECKSCCFACNPPEHTTNFELQPGDYQLSLRALRCGAVVAQTPPAVVRTVRAAEITNLNAIEVLLEPPDAGALVICPTNGAGADLAQPCP